MVISLLVIGWYGDIIVGDSFVLHMRGQLRTPEADWVCIPDTTLDLHRRITGVMPEGQDPAHQA